MNLHDLNIAVLGAGRSGRAAARLAMKHGGRACVFDTSQAITGWPEDIPLHAGATQEDGHAFRADLVVISPGIETDCPFVKSFGREGVETIGEMELASRFYRGKIIAITGTNGKTTTTYLVEHIARVAGKRTGVIGTVGIRIGDEAEKSAHTTPESPDLQQLFARMRDARCDVVAMEVSSHALDLDRTWDAAFAVTAFSNLTQDHLDYHHTFEAYFEAKARLFSKDYPAKRVICIDDKWGKELLRRSSVAEDSVVTTGFDPSAQIHPVDVQYAPTHTTVTLDVRGSLYTFDYPLVGRFNVENIMCAFGIGLQLGFSADVVVEALEEAPQIPGRLERVNAPNTGGVSVFVDYAHTPDALEKALASIMALTPGRTICVFGCGGDRDASKRPIMGRAALAADHAVVTSDNPRTEDPQAIIEDIVSGMGSGEGRFEVEADRRAAIALAIAQAKAGDSILVAGKGHEDYQLVGDQVLSFDDRIVAAEELRRAFGDEPAAE